MKVHISVDFEGGAAIVGADTDPKITTIVARTLEWAGDDLFQLI